MGQTKRALSHEDYTVAWLCALPVEMAAAEAMLDERHPGLPISSSDQNTYTLGRIHVHNVVISCLPSGVYGTTSAASLAAELQSTFSSIRFGLMVGIGGGVPGAPADIQLGEVVVSKPTRDFGGVVQYDYGKLEIGEQFACGIHYGLIASGNKVIKDGKMRDQLAKDYGILCFEMEAAGLMDNFPCLVIRGISDYADASKNKKWQGCASLTASAFSKELLSVIQESNNLKTLLERITQYDHERVYQRLLRKRLVGTTRWFMDHTSFQLWFSEKAYPFLWCTGKIGSGKTIIARTSVIEEVRRGSATETGPTIFFYCDENRESQQGLTVLSSVIKQLLEFSMRTSVSLPSDVQEMLQRYFGPKRRTPDIEDLQDIFTRLFYLMPGATYVLDGLDALEQTDTKCLLTYLQSLFCSSSQPSPTSRIFFLSRDYLAGNMSIDVFFPSVTRISTSENVMHDIRVYIEDSIADKMLRKRLTADNSLVNEMKRVLLVESLGVFLWVYLQIEILWDTCVTDAEIRRALKTLPKDLEETYRRCVGRINLHDPRTIRAIIWVRFAIRPLRPEELQEAVAFDTTDRTWDSTKIPRVDFVVGSCANLLVLDSDNYVCFAHSSINQCLDKHRHSIPGFPGCFEDGDRHCGELCISYLSFSEFRLWLVKEKDVTSRITVPHLPSLAAAPLGQNIFRWLFAENSSRELSISLPFRTIRTTSVPSRSQYRFLGYATNTWALHAKYLQTSGVLWERFTRLALTYNESWNIHPWSSGGQSQLSHLHGLFGWAVDKRHGPLLHLALQFEDRLRRVCDLPLVDKHLPALHLACKRGDEEIVKKLMAICDVNKIALEGLGPLHYAAVKNYMRVVDVLLNAPGIDIDILSKSSETPLWLAASNGWTGIAESRIESGAQIESKNNKSQTPLIVASKLGHLATVELLVQRGANLGTRDSEGHSAVSWAIRKQPRGIVQEQYDIIYFMVEKGLNPNSKFKQENPHEPQSLLAWAAARDHESLVNLLINRGADLELQDDVGWTALTKAAQFARQTTLTLLLKHGANINYPRNDMFTPLQIAVERGDIRTTQYLMKNGADVNHKGMASRGPLGSAARHGENGIVKIIKGRTPLIRAAEEGHGVVVETLLEYGANCNALDDTGQTALIRATHYGHLHVAKLLAKYSGSE
ncbi:hypothetical protein BDW59DRAFT_176537 [Aspergillus cavernicola]|uniref:Nephrocystin 3-like N-terminal domain-containing protein n=1 Tax=Aspergillus cavernicola TaxID=176166 RepID=A0ABR4HFL4_9EURO